MRLSYAKAIQQALEDELNSNPNVIMFGEDIQKNLYGYTEGFEQKFGKNRIINIPLAEAGVVGVACGAAMCGMRPVVDLTVSNFLYVAMDQIVSIAAKTCYMYAGKYHIPLTIFCSNMQGGGNAAQHSDRLHSLFATIPGLKVICPATAQDMYSMLRGAIQDNNPVLCFADRSIFWREEEVDTTIITPPGISQKVQDGDDLTIITVSSCLQMVLDILSDLKSANMNPDIIDIRSTMPLDYHDIMKSVEKTGHVVICDTSTRRGSVANDIATYIYENAFSLLKQPIKIITSEDFPVPFRDYLEKEILVTRDKIRTQLLNGEM